MQTDSSRKAFNAGDSHLSLWTRSCETIWKSAVSKCSGISGPGDMALVPKGTRHRPICTGLVKLLLIDKAGALNNDNCGGTYSN